MGSEQDAQCSEQDAQCSEQDAQCSEQDAQCSEQDARTTARISQFLTLWFKCRTAYLEIGTSRNVETLRGTSLQALFYYIADPILKFYCPLAVTVSCSRRWCYRHRFNPQAPTEAKIINSSQKRR